MSKKDFVTFARMIRAQRHKAIAEYRIAPSHPALPAKLEQIDSIMSELMDIFQNDNSQFNREKFMQACEIE